MAPKKAVLKKPSVVLKKPSSVGKVGNFMEIAKVDSQGALLSATRVSVRGKSLVIPAGWSFEHAFSEVWYACKTADNLMKFFPMTALEQLHKILPSEMQYFPRSYFLEVYNNDCEVIWSLKEILRREAEQFERLGVKQEVTVDPN